MKIHNVDQRSPEWFMIRKGRISGTDLRKVTGTKIVRDNYFYEHLAERLTRGLPDDESALNRGVRLEDEARERFETETGKKVEVVGFVTSSKNEFIGSSPDGLIKTRGKYKEALEIKCLSSANHLRAFLEQKIPSDYLSQGIQYFVTNPDLVTLYFGFYDTRIEEVPFFVLTMKRKDLGDEITEDEEAQLRFLKEIDTALSKLVTL
jgi:putative phage-type endonuclease